MALSQHPPVYCLTAVHWVKLRPKPQTLNPHFGSSHFGSSLFSERWFRPTSPVDASGDSVMDAATQPIADDDGEGDDEESPLTHASPAAEGGDRLHGLLQHEDLHARNEALRDAAIAAEALKAATTSAEVLPLSGPNPYAIAAAASVSNPVTTSVPLSLPVNARKQKDRLESPEKKHRTDKKKIETGAKLPGGGGAGSPTSFWRGRCKADLMLLSWPPQLLLNPQTGLPKFSTWTPLPLRPSRARSETFGTCLLGGRKKSCQSCILTKHIFPRFPTRCKTWIRDRKDLSKAQGDMVARLNHMEAEARDLKTRSRSVSPAPPLPDQSPRSTTASTLGGRRVVDDFQIVIGGWNDAKRGDIEAEIRHLFELNQASPLLHNIHVPFVRSKFARVELLYTGGNLAERRKVQNLVIEALKKTFRDFRSNIAGQQDKTLWVTRNRSKEDREKIRALVSIKDWALKHTSAILVDLDWRGKLWIRGEQVLYWHQFRKPEEGSMMLTNAAGDETGWWVDVHQLSRILAIPVDQVRDELLD